MRPNHPIQSPPKTPPQPPPVKLNASSESPSQSPKRRTNNHSQAMSPAKYAGKTLLRRPFGKMQMPPTPHSTSTQHSPPQPPSDHRQNCPFTTTTADRSNRDASNAPPRAPFFRGCLECRHLVSCQVRQGNGAQRRRRCSRSTELGRRF